MERDNYDSNNENCIEWIKNDDIATCTITQASYITKIRNLVEKYPDECKIVQENADGSIVARVPRSAIKISIRKLALSDDEKLERRRRITEAKLKDE